MREIYCFSNPTWPTVEIEVSLRYKGMVQVFAILKRMPEVKRVEKDQDRQGFTVEFKTKKWRDISAIWIVEIINQLCCEGKAHVGRVS